MTYYAYLFEAHTIQPFIFNSGKMATMVGSSELLEYLIAESPGDSDDSDKSLITPLDQLMERSDLKNRVWFSRRGGGAFYLLSDDETALRTLRDAWSLLVPQMAPGLPFTQAIAGGDTAKKAIQAAKQQLAQQRNQPPSLLPQVGPWVRRSPRTGLPAVGIAYEAGGTRLWADAGTLMKKEFADREHSALLERKFQLDANQTPDTPPYVFPRNLEREDEAIPEEENGEQGGDSQGLQNQNKAKRLPVTPYFPHRADNHYVGIVHADGNGLGEILLKLSDSLKDDENYAAIFYELSQQIDAATCAAARDALKPLYVDAQTQQIRKKQTGAGVAGEEVRVMPFRPLILGGDDLTAVIRGDHALQYTHDFLAAFEKQTTIHLQALHKKYPAIPSCMTACAGVTLLKSNQPFALGYELAESLAAYAKGVSRAHKKDHDLKFIPSSLVFHRVTSTLIEDYAHARERELLAEDEHGRYQLTLGAYGVGKYADTLPVFKDLKALHTLFNQAEMARGPARHYLTQLHSNRLQASTIWQRWCGNMDERMPVIYKDYKALEQRLLKGLMKKGGMADFGPFAGGKGEDYQSFLGDLNSWLAVEGN